MKLNNRIQFPDSARVWNIDGSAEREKQIELFKSEKFLENILIQVFCILLKFCSSYVTFSHTLSFDICFNILLYKRFLDNSTSENLYIIYQIKSNQIIYSVTVLSCKKNETIKYLINCACREKPGSGICFHGFYLT